MGEFEELRKVGTKVSRAAEIELQKKQHQMEYEDSQRKRQEDANRRKKEAETQKLLRQELERKRIEEEHRKKEAAALLRAKERAREKERALEKERENQERARKQKQNPNAPTYSSSRSRVGATGSSGSSHAYDNKPAPRKQEYSFEFLQKMAQPNGSSRSDGRGGDQSRYSRDGDRSSSSTSTTASRQAAVEKLKVTRGISPERTLSPSQSLGSSRIMKRPPVKRSTVAKSVFPPVRRTITGVNSVRDAGLKAVHGGLIALNTKKRDLRSIEEITADLHSHGSRQEERMRKIKAVEQERERMMQQREKALQAAKYSRALMGDDPQETEKLHKEIEGDSKSSARRKVGRSSQSRSRSPSPRRRKSRSKSPVKRRSKSPVRRRRSISPAHKRRSYSPERKRSMSPPARRKRSASPPRRKPSRDMDRDRERDRDRDRERDRDRGFSSGKSIKSKPTNGSVKRRVSRSPSPRPMSKKWAGSPRGGRGGYDEDLSVSSVIGSIFGTRYRARVEDEDLSDDMEARPDEVFREEARSARIARQEDEMEAELERQQTERARKRKLEREKERNR